jgi:hypothetical protein
MSAVGSAALFLPALSTLAIALKGFVQNFPRTDGKNTSKKSAALIRHGQRPHGSSKEKSKLH